MSHVQHDDTRETPTGKIAMQVEMRRAGRRKRVHHGGTLCSGCYDEPPISGQRYGKKCHAARERKRRAAQAEELKRLRALAQQQGQGHG
jgi:hypothetical protein